MISKEKLDRSAAMAFKIKDVIAEGQEEIDPEVALPALACIASGILSIQDPRPQKDLMDQFFLAILTALEGETPANLSRVTRMRRLLGQFETAMRLDSDPGIIVMALIHASAYMICRADDPMEAFQAFFDKVTALMNTARQAEEEAPGKPH